MKKLSFIFAVLQVTMLLSCKEKLKNEHTHSIKMQSDYLKPPIAAVKAKEFTEHGYKRIDNYFWLKEKENPEVIKYLKAENTYCDSVMKHTETLRKKLFDEMKARIKEVDQSVPVFENGYFYYNRTEEGKQYAIICRKKGDLKANEEILIDGNKMAEGKSTFLLNSFNLSSDNKILAYASNFNGSYAEFTLKFKNLETNKEIIESIEKVDGFEWANDNKTVFYVVANEALRPYRVYKHVLGSKEKDELIFEEKDDQFNVGLGKSKNNELIFISSGSFTSSEVRFISADKPNEQFKIFFPREKDVIYEVVHHKSKFFILYKDDNNKNYKILEAPLKGYEDKKSWKDVIPYDPETKIEEIDVFEKYLTMSVRNGGLSQIRIMDLANKKISSIKFPEPVYTVYKSNTPGYNSTKLRYSYSSLNRPNSVFDYDMVENKSKKLKEQEIPSGFKADDYEVKRLFATASDGVKVPMAIVYKKGLELNGKNPTLLYSYGSYGYSTEANFNANVYSLINRGFIFAIAQIRGGSEMGEKWYDDGKLMNKKNTFTDFVSCAEELVKLKYTSSDFLAINGGSAGGLLMGAVTNLRPDLFKVVVADVPFVDVINTMLDSSLPLTTQEYEQWGNPNEKLAYDYILSYSPYDNLKAVNYPNILATGGINDSQVSYHEPAKWVAKIRALKKDNNIVLLKTNMDSGHGGASGRFDRLKEVAFRYAFILDRMGLSE